MWEVSSTLQGLRTQSSAYPNWDDLQVVHIVDWSQNGAGNKMRCWRSKWLVQTYTTDCIRYEWGAWEYTVWMSPVVRQESSAARIKLVSRDHTDRDHGPVSRQSSERAAMEQWLTSVAQPTQGCNSPTYLWRKRWQNLPAKDASNRHQTT